MLFEFNIGFCEADDILLNMTEYRVLTTECNQASLTQQTYCLF